MKKYLLFFLATMLTTVARAADGDTFTYNGLNYTILSEANHTAEVDVNKNVSGSLSIPSAVKNNDSDYIVTSIGYRAFDNCSSLTSVNIPSSVTSIGIYAFKGCSSLTSVTIPNSVIELGDGAFDGCESLTSVTIPNSITSIADDTFIGCRSLTSVTIPKSVTTIGARAFDDCRNLTSVTIPNSVTEIGARAFDSCESLTSVTIPNSVISIGWQAFADCKNLTSVTIPNSVTSIGYGPFEGCTNLNEIKVEDGNKFYCSDNGALYNFEKTHLIQCPGTKKEFEIPFSVASIDSYAFSGCLKLTSVTIPNSVTSIDSHAFYGCTWLTSVTIPNSVTELAEDVFLNCSNLTSVIIPNSVTEIGNNTFYLCSNLRTIIDLSITPQKVVTDTYYHSFKGVPSDAVIYIPKDSYMTYKEAEGWSQFSDFREMGAFGITISASTLELAKDETAELTVSVVKDDDVTVGDHEWVSFNPEVATVEDGKVTAVASGTTTINYTEYTIYGGIAVPHTVACKVTVTVTTGIYDILEDDAVPTDVFNLQGFQVLRNATEDEINTFPAGIYIIRQGNTTKKIAVK